MKLRIEREELTDKTPGEFFVDDNHFAWTLEDVKRNGDEYVFGKTCVPYGRYRVIISFSNRFQRRMPQLINIRGGNIMFGGRSIDQCGIRLHGGNVVDDTGGCPLIGSQRKENLDVFDCKEINDKLISLIEAADTTSEVYLDIVKKEMV